jgi:hypothetical protein
VNHALNAWECWEAGRVILSLRLPCITRPLWLRTVTHRLVGPTGLYMHCASLPVGLSTDPVRVCSFFINIISVLFLIYLRFLIQIWAIKVLCLSVFSVGGHIQDWNLLRDIILFYLSGLFRILVLSEGISPLALSWYRESRDAVLWPKWV